MKPYYYVYRRGHGPPRIKHDTLESARIEAERLAGSHPGEAFEILKCVAVSSSSKISTFWMDGEGPSTVAKSATVQTDQGGWIEYKQGDPIPTDYRQIKVSTGEMRDNTPEGIWDESFWVKDSPEDTYYITHYKP